MISPNCEFYTGIGICFYRNTNDKTLSYINKCYLFGEKEEKVKSLENICEVAFHLNRLKEYIKVKESHGED